MRFKYSVMETILKAALCLWSGLLCLAAPAPERTEAENPSGLSECHNGRIEQCLQNFKSSFTGYNLEEMPLNERRDFLKAKCSEYNEALLCVHMSMLTCRMTDYHRELIAGAVGHVRMFMQDACNQPREEEEETPNEVDTTERADTSSPHQQPAREVTAVMATSARSTNAPPASTASAAMAGDEKRQGYMGIDMRQQDAPEPGASDRQQVSKEQGPHRHTKTMLAVSGVSDSTAPPTNTDNSIYNKYASPFVAVDSNADFLRQKNNEHAYKYTNAASNLLALNTLLAFTMVGALCFEFGYS